MKKIFKSKRDNENVLIQKLIAGDQQAFEHIVEEYHNIMLSVARAIVGESIAEEVVQEAWLSAIKALPRFEHRSSLKTWLIQIVSNSAKSRVRRENRYIPLEDSTDPQRDNNYDHKGHWLDPISSWENNTPEDIIANEQLQLIISERFQNLPAMQRSVLTMIDSEDMKLEEVCNILDISSSNARVLLHRARVSIHQCIDEYQGKEET